jgi:hypothetical protein
MRLSSIIEIRTNHNDGSRFVQYSDGVVKHYPYESEQFESRFRWTYLALHGAEKCEEFRAALAEFEILKN